MAVSGGYAYVTDGYSGLVIIDISDPTNPVQAGHYDTVGDAVGVAVSGGYAYVADGDNGLVILSSIIDSDSDGIADVEDNCPCIHNPEQEDLDGDGLGDVCDNDDDNDGVPDSGDNCPINYNSDQSDSDYDGIGDACDEYYGSDTVVIEIEDKVNEAVGIITSLHELPGGNGMINKLQNIMKIIGNAMTSYQEGTITPDEYMVQLSEASDLLTGFDNQLEAKAGNNQIPQEEADLLKGLSAQIRACIESLMDNS